MMKEYVDKRLMVLKKTEKYCITCICVCVCAHYMFSIQHNNGVCVGSLARTLVATRKMFAQ